MGATELIYKAVLFDLDGTVLDTSDLIISAFRHTFQKHCNRELTPLEIHAFFGKTLRSAIEHFAPDKVEESIQSFREFNLVHHDQMTKIFSGVTETIQSLHEAGIMTVIVTSKTKKTALRGLKLFNLDHYFPIIIGSDQCQNHKPHPEPIQKALFQLEMKPEECLMVGDSPFDLISARRAGVKTVAVRWTRVSWKTILHEVPDFTLENMHELLAICGI